MLPAKSHISATEAFLVERSSDVTRLRLATVADSAFLLGLRLDPARNQNISATSDDLPAQMSWMRAYDSRHKEGREAYFVIEVGQEPQGALRLYDYLPARDSFGWGSWIVRPGAPAPTAHQSAILAYDLAFGALCFTHAHFDVRQANVSVWKFHEKMGAGMIRSDSLDRFYEYRVEDYRAARSRLQKFTQLRDFR